MDGGLVYICVWSYFLNLEFACPNGYAYKFSKTHLIGELASIHYNVLIDRLIH